ncbi:PrsW family intramembrane metalloprotease [Romboutsia sp.]|uniref:PrsW family intramembrane metalloprotease n=1 Tax=Romboutsia sp. TaxID=1965302 RepID=UPI002B6C0ED0|nr:PrsW family glutamic-type intramembrane protease [Romboutsia sp.]HSQ88934.1 PrsW family glutamic-type intramembrane protease [Romboutsia sp.]
MKLSLLVLAIAPIIACILWIYLKDRYDKEPIMILGKFFILGILMSAIAIIVENFLMKINIFEGYSSLIYISFIVAALTEEGLKGLVLIPNVLKEKNFNEKLDGIIYSIFLSLGFATIENIIYILFEDYQTAFEVGIIRAVISVPAHIMFAITMGYYVSKYKFSNKSIKKREYLIMSILVPILIHGGFDFILMIEYRWSIIVFAIYIVFLWKINLDKLDDYINKSKKRFFRIRKKKGRDYKS